MYSLKTETVERLLQWYRLNRRDLPWRRDKDPYGIWLSEIMLQQTRVEAVIEYYERFRKQYPDVSSLAEADDKTLLRLWEGLGYYSRVRNMKKSAQVLMEQYDGKLPQDPKELQKLPGIGSYTAGAIAAIAFGLPAAAVDGNVFRVLTRYFGIRKDIADPKLKKELEQIITDFYKENGISDPDDISDLTQSLMELGALVCLPNGRPLCETCPFSAECMAHKEDLTGIIPVRSGNKERKVIDRTVFVIRDPDRFLLHRRPAKGLLAGMYEFPGIDQKLNETEAVDHLEKLGIKVGSLKPLPSARHVFTHLEWQMQAYEANIDKLPDMDQEEYVSADRDRLKSLAIPSAFRVYLDHYGLREVKK